MLWCSHEEKMHYFFLKKPHSGHISDLQTNWMNSFGEHRFVFTKFLDPWGRPCQILGDTGREWGPKFGPLISLMLLFTECVED